MLDLFRKVTFAFLGLFAMGWGTQTSAGQASQEEPLTRDEMLELLDNAYYVNKKIKESGILEDPRFVPEFSEIMHEILGLLRKRIRRTDFSSYSKEEKQKIQKFASYAVLYISGKFDVIGQLFIDDRISREELKTVLYLRHFFASVELVDFIEKPKNKMLYERVAAVETLVHWIEK